jgi:hypothetical protein
LTTAYPKAKVIITGHSLGGILATFAALDVKSILSPKTDLSFYTFGCPRPGNDDFADYVMTVFPNGDYSRVTHLKDLVPHVPSKNLGYKHAGQEIWYYSPIVGDLSFAVCENGVGLEENKTCSNSFFIASSIDDHSLYLDLSISWMCDAYEQPNQKLPQDGVQVSSESMSDYIAKIRDQFEITAKDIEDKDLYWLSKSTEEIEKVIFESSSKQQPRPL